MVNFENVSTPWGKSQGGQLLAPGIKQYHTASHGGIKLFKKLNDQIPVGFRRYDGWYEEDCDSLIVWYYHYDALEAHMRASGMSGYRLSADEYFAKFSRDWFKEQLERWFVPETIYYFGTHHSEDVLGKHGLDNIQARIACIRRKEATPLPCKGDRIIFDVPISFYGWANPVADFIYRYGNHFARTDGGGLCRIRHWQDRDFRVEQEKGR